MKNKRIDFFNELNIGCIPYMHAKKPPTDQSHCILLRCPLCHLKMWVSERKLKMKKENKNSKLYCFTCILKELIAQGYDPKEVELLNINNIN